MARSRNIKPGFFVNESLVELPFSTRLLFIGLWTVADREGRLEDRPKKIKMSVFPADNVDVDKGLTELHNAGLIVRYVAEEKGFIEIVNFLKHQNPHVKEVASTIPAPDLHGASTIRATLIPDSLLLIPDSLTLGSSEPKPRKVKEKNPDDWIQTLKKEPIYAHVDFDRELRKAEIWINDHPGRKLTATFFKNWINKIEPPIIVPKRESRLTPAQIEAERICAESQKAFYGQI